jgi:antitoxin (DNA-binding transcriptional repressor) of toxin-antitoxin stability system
MRFLTVRDLRTKSAEVWRSLSREKEMVVTYNGRPVAILSSVAEDSVEGALQAIRQARAVQAVASLQRESVAKGTDAITEQEIDTEIRAVRKKRKR